MLTVECPKCKKLSLNIKRPTSKCGSCGRIFKAHELQRKWAKVFLPSKVCNKDPLEEPFVPCVTCLADSMLYHKKLRKWICFNCANTWNKSELSICKRCNFYSDDISESGICSDCWDDYINVNLDVIPIFEPNDNLENLPK